MGEGKGFSRDGRCYVDGTDGIDRWDLCWENHDSERVRKGRERIRAGEGPDVQGRGSGYTVRGQVFPMIESSYVDIAEKQRLVFSTALRPSPRGPFIETLCSALVPGYGSKAASSEQRAVPKLRAD